jgi:hypothetical protein
MDDWKEEGLDKVDVAIGTIVERGSLHSYQKAALTALLALDSNFDEVQITDWERGRADAASEAPEFSLSYLDRCIRMAQK